MSLITGPGRYLTRDGEEVDVFRNDDSDYPWAYEVLGGQITVDDDGYLIRSSAPLRADIVAKAPEVAPTKEEAPRLDDGGLAFPMPEPNIPAGHYYEGPGARPGMTLRDYFAAKIAAGEFAAEAEGVSERYFALTAERAYKMADAMLAARRRTA